MSSKSREMETATIINPSALEPLYAPWEEPSAHRLRGDRPGDPAKVVKTRRPSPIVTVNNLRMAVREWREAYYVGASDTTRQLLAHWFERPHRATTPSGEEYEFRYYFCQREAIETAIYLKEVRQINCLSQIVADFGGGKVFDLDPLIPSEWRGDWNMSVVLQDEASGAATGGVMYLTNIHRLYDMSKRKGKKAGETYDFMGPAVSKATALDTGAALRDRITSHNRVMILNDEAHHVWDPDSAWNEAISYLHATIKSRTGGEVVAQLDFTATPKDNRGQLFKHIICDAPLGEAVDGGIVKTPVIGKGDKSLSEEPSDNAAYRYDRHLRLGYARWQRSREEWDKSGKKALLFVMCDDTKAADQITTRLNTDETFKQLNGKTINLHTNLKGKLKKIGRGANARTEFVETEKEISDEDLKALRKLSRELDENTSPYFCIVSVLMLREGWDVRNVTAIVPLRPYALKDKTKLSGVFESVTTRFNVSGARDLLAQVEAVNDFRNTYIAHHEKDLTDRRLSGASLRQWVECLAAIHGYS